MPKRVRLPVSVLEKAKTLASQPTRRPAPPAAPRAKKPLAREKVIAALKKLHPMD
jgi:hypothetical protein